MAYLTGTMHIDRHIDVNAPELAKIVVPGQMSHSHPSGVIFIAAQSSTCGDHDKLQVSHVPQGFDIGLMTIVTALQAKLTLALQTLRMSCFPVPNPTDLSSVFEGDIFKIYMYYDI